jgi:RNA polymerase sigma-70 factor (ECF subfamily)
VLDVDTFTTLLSACYQHCWLIAAAVTGDRAEADDIVQEASLTALRKLPDFTVGTNFTAWMAQIVRWTALNHVKKTNRRNVVVVDPSALDRDCSTAAATVPTPVAADGRLIADQTEFDDDVLSALHDIADVARACLLLRAVQRLPYDEIAEILRIPQGTAMSHVHRAKQTIRERLQHRYQPTAKAILDQGQT